MVQLKAIELESDAPLPTQVPPFHLRVVLPTRRNIHNMQLFQVDPSESGSEFFRKLREMSHHEQSGVGRVLQSFVLGFSMQTLAVSSAVIVPVRRTLVYQWLVADFRMRWILKVKSTRSPSRSLRWSKTLSLAMALSSPKLSWDTQTSSRDTRHLQSTTRRSLVVT